MSPSLARLVALAFAVSAASWAAGCDSLPGEETNTGTVFERLDRQSRFETLTAALTATGLSSLLQGGAAYTVLAPTDIAFEYLGADVLTALRTPANAALFTRVLRHHIVEGRLAPEDFTDGRQLTTLDGRTLTVRRTGPVAQVDGVTLNLADPIDAEGSVAYPLADVLLGAVTARERVEVSPSLDRFRGQAAAVGLLNRASSLGSVTLLAPINDAFSALGQVGGRLFDLSSTADIRARVLPFHLIPGTPVLADGAVWTSVEGAPLPVRIRDGVTTVGGRRVLRVEKTADGRLVVLGGVILDPLTLAQRLRIEPTVLLYWQEVQARLPALWSRLGRDDAEFTVFAPTDAAYQGRGADVNNALADPLNAALNLRVLQAHVVEGRITPSDLVSGRTLTTLDGTVLLVEVAGGVVTVDGRAVGPARATSNGILYSVGAFIYSDVDGLDSALLQGYTQHVSAVRRAGLESQFRQPGLTVFLASNALYLGAGGRLAAPRGFLLYNATTEAVPTLGPLSFTALDGRTRTVRVVACPDGSDSETPRDRECSPFQFTDGTQVYQGLRSRDQASILHVMRSLSFPPSL